MALIGKRKLRYIEIDNGSVYSRPTSPLSTPIGRIMVDYKKKFVFKPYTEYMCHGNVCQYIKTNVLSDILRILRSKKKKGMYKRLENV